MGAPKRTQQLPWVSVTYFVYLAVFTHILYQAGVQWVEAYRFAEEHNITLVGGGSRVVLLESNIDPTQEATSQSVLREAG